MSGVEKMVLQDNKNAVALWGKNIGKAVMVLAAGIVFGTLLLTLAYMLPVNPENRDISYGIIEREGWYPRTSIVSQGQHFQSFYPDVLDNFTDKIMLSTAMDSSEGNALVRAMESYSEYIGSYNHYWHGYVAILRPLLYIFDFSELRTLNGACQMLLVALLIWLIGREKGIRHALALLTSYILLNPRTTALGLQYTWVFYVAYGGTFVLLAKRRFFEKKDRYLYFFIVLGMLTCYLDMLTFPLLAWGFPLVWWIAMGEEERKAFEWLKCVVLSGIAWIFGYAGIWAAKWWIATLVLKRNVFETAVKEIFFCSGTTETRMGNLITGWNTIYVNWRHYAYKIYMLILACWLFWWIGCSLRKKWRKSTKACAFFLIGISSVVWYFVLSNHTMIHHFFTHRIYGVSIAAFLALVLESVDNAGAGGKLLKRERTGMFALFGVSVLLACCFSQLAKEDISVTNGMGDFRQIQMEERLEMEFIPSLNTVGDIHFGLECESTQGHYDIKVWEGDKLKYQNTFRLADSKGGNYHELVTWWLLRHGETYRVTVEAFETDKPVSVWLTQDGDMPLPEWGEVSVDGQKTGGQMLMGVRYLDRHAVPGERKVFLVFTWIGIFMAAGYMLWGIEMAR